MRAVWLVPVGDVERSLLDVARLAILRELKMACRDGIPAINASFAFHPERGQYHSTLLLDHISKIDTGDDLVIAVTPVDLFIPILTFVFGEAQLGGRAAIVSYHRLSQPFYGLPEDRFILGDRLAKEVVHELGHTLSLTHCDDYECVMASSYAVEWLDLKGRALCDNCRARAFAERGREVSDSRGR